MTPIKKYDKEKAAVWFTVLKFLEVMISLFLIVGIYGLGILSNYLVKFSLGDFLNIGIKKGFWGIWLAGLNLSIFILFILIILGVLIYLGYIVILGYLKLNWHWAKLITQTPEGKKEREEEIYQSKLKKDEVKRKVYGLIKGDEVTLKKNLEVGDYYGGKKFTSQKKYKASSKDKLIISSVWSDGDIRLKELDHYYTREMLDLKTKFKRKNDRKN